MKQWLPSHPTGLLYRDCTTGMAHGNIRWPEGRPPTPFGCRWCGAEQRGHGRRSLRGQSPHTWEQPTQAQIKARMLARRAAYKAVCRCPDPMEALAPLPLAPVVDPWKCEAEHCRMHDYLIGGWLRPLSFGEAVDVWAGGAS
ncbi:hypothetical protein [Streptomyces broussonetiae]|uniref:Uncharacterized protein n=1 Tax=Streptomyces broussonetiae TaxID=2686304 RepID=A0ABV5E5R1_9ACTN